MRSLKVHSRYWQRQVKLRFAEWDGVFGVDPEEKFFDGWSGMPEFGAPSMATFPTLEAPAQVSLGEEPSGGSS